MTTDPTIVEDIQADISATITDLVILTDLIGQLVTTRQRGLGFLTPQGRQILDQLTRLEQTERRAQPTQPLGLRWLNRESSTAGTGDVPAPVTMSAAAVDAEIYFTVHDLTRRVGKALARVEPVVETDRGWCRWPRRPRHAPEPNSIELMGHLRTLVWDSPSPSLLGDVLHSLQRLVEAADLVVNGNDRTQLGDCPHCGRPTLTVYFRDDVIRCDKDPVTGHFQACRCSDPYCDCKQKPISFRHSWWRVPRNAPDPRLAHDWHDLAGRLNLKRAIQKEPTR